jgi:2-keto-3-deoxy-L-rhamnonate aldolase RhmA
MGSISVRGAKLYTKVKDIASRWERVGHDDTPEGRRAVMLGLARARRAGKRLGRPRANGPSPQAVTRLRKQGVSWAAIADELHCTVGVARLRAKEGRSARMGSAA